MAITSHKLVQDSSKSCTPKRHDSMWGLLNNQQLGISMESGLTVYRHPCGKGNSAISGALRRARCLLSWNYHKSCQVWSSRSFLQFVCALRPNQANHQQLCLSGERSHLWFTCARDFVMLHKLILFVYVVDDTCCCFSTWPPWFPCLRDCDMLHKVIPPF